MENPKTYENKRQQQLVDDKKSLEEQTIQKYKTYCEKMDKYYQSHKKKGYDFRGELDMGCGPSILVFILFICVMWVCIGSIYPLLVERNIFDGDATLLFVILIILPAIGISYLIVFILLKIISNSSISSTEKNNQKLSENISQSKAKYKETLDADKHESMINLEDQYARDVKTYREKYEDTVAQNSDRFVSAEASDYMISEMYKHFEPMIDNADRSSNIRTVIAPYIIKVYYDKVTSSGVNFSFDKQRWSNLPEHMERAGLARALAVLLKTKVEVEKIEDIRGSLATVDFEIDYDEIDCVTVTVRYSAPNSHYIEIKNW